MTRNLRRAAGTAAVSVVLMVGAVACAGSDGEPSAGSTTLQATTATTSPLGDLGDLDGAARGLSGGDLDCYDLQLALVALTTLPGAASAGTEQAAVDQMQEDLRVLRGQVPADVVADFDTYAEGVQAYAEALKGVDVTDLSDPATQQQVSDAAEALESPSMTAAEDNIEKYFAATCPAPSPTTAPS